MENTKFSTTPEGNALRITALIDIPRHGVKAGDRGGLIDSEDCLSQSGDCWVDATSIVKTGSRVRDHAIVTSYSIVSLHSGIEHSAVVTSSHVSNSIIHGVVRCASVHDSAIYDEARVDADDDYLYLGVADATLSRDAIITQSTDVLIARVAASEIFGATLFRRATDPGHGLQVGCWFGTVAAFREMIQSDDWVEAGPDEIALRRPELLAFADMCDARIASWGILHEGED